MFKTYRHLLEMIRFSHTIFALPFALFSAVMAWHLGWLARLSGTTTNASSSLGWRQFVGIWLCMVTARSAAMSLNRLADRELDALNPRTADRHLPAGILSVARVRRYAAGNMIVFVLGTLLFLPNWLPFYMSVPILLFLWGYSYTKRYTALSHFWLGTALAMAPVAAWIAIRGQVVLAQPSDLLPAVVLGGVVLSWVAGFDMIYACQDYDADLRNNLHSMPVRLGIPGALRLAAGCHMVTIALLATLPEVYPHFGWIYWAGVAVVSGLLVYEHAVVRPDDLSRVNLAFFRVNALISLGLFIIGSLDLFAGGR